MFCLLQAELLHLPKWTSKATVEGYLPLSLARLSPLTSKLRRAVAIMKNRDDVTREDANDGDLG
jgi:hypothetical protein